MVAPLAIYPVNHKIANVDTNLLHKQMVTMSARAIARMTITAINTIVESSYCDPREPLGCTSSPAMTRHNLNSESWL